LQSGVAARALEFLILTARTGEVVAARAAEIDGSVWTIPAERMKGGKEHRVPLSAPALAIVERIKAEHGDVYLFSGAKPGKPLSNMTMLALIERMDRGDLTAHGFRSTFRDWAAERTDFPREVAEMALAHTIGSKVEAAYRRGDLFDKRIALMDQWAAFCGSAGMTRASVEVLPMRQAR
jgi:integrase